MMNLTHRREFLARSLVAAGAAAVGTWSAVSAQDQTKKGPTPTEALPVVDTHIHLWDLERFRLPWITRDSPLNRSFVMTDYQEATRGLNVTRGIYMEVDVDPAQHVAEAEYVTGICRQANTPLVGAVIGGRPGQDEFAAYVQRFRDNRYVKGVRQVLHGDSTPAGYCRSANFVRGVRLLGDAGLRFDMCLRSTDIADGIYLAENCPHTKLILDHCGNGPVEATDRTQWQRDMERLARSRDDIMCKISGIVVQARQGWTADDLAPVINHSLAAFGPDRVMFAGDWPVCTTRATYRQWLEALKSIVHNRPADEQRKLFHDNAARFYGLG